VHCGRRRGGVPCARSGQQLGAGGAGRAHDDDPADLSDKRQTLRQRVVCGIGRETEGATMSDAPKKLHIKTYGCQMNVYDSERMAEAMGAKGYVLTDDVAEADMVLLNTCHIREKAAEKVYSDLGRLRPFKEAKPDLKIGVAGCVAQAEGAEILRRMPLVDLVVGSQNYHRLPAMVEAVERGEHPVDTEFTAEDKFDLLPERPVQTRPTAFLTVQEGCDKFCTFCVVPYTRGAEVSRPVANIVDDVRRLADNGVREITLIGQNVNAYHGDGPDGRVWPLGRLLQHLAKIPGIVRLRYSTSHPRDVDQSLIDAHRDLAALMPFVHLPVQSGSDAILAAMNRKHTADDYRRLVDRFRDANPAIAFSSDFIVGFPGETDEDFQATLALVTRNGLRARLSRSNIRRARARLRPAARAWLPRWPMPVCRNCRR